ncbi:unnamed protein product [Rhodiola kirilowii]
MDKLRKENAALKESVVRFENKSYSLELELVKFKKDGDYTSKKLHEVQERYSELEQKTVRHVYELNRAIRESSVGAKLESASHI